MDDREHFKLNDDTMRHLETLAQAPGELQFRLELVYAIKGIRREMRADTKQILERIERAEKAIIGPVRVTNIVNKELKDNVGIGNLKTEVKRLWWMIGLLVVAIMGLVIAKALK